MPELPEVEILVRYLRPLLRGKTIRSIRVHRARVIRPNTARELECGLVAANFREVERRGKFLIFNLRQARSRSGIQLIGHLGMTGRMYLQSKRAPLPKHTAVEMDLGRQRFVYEDQRFFGRLSFDASSLQRLGPEPLSPQFTTRYLLAALKNSQRAIKVRLLDQDLVAGVGNIYASEALHRARISPQLPAGKLTAAQVRALRNSLRAVLQQAIRFGSTIPLNHGPGQSDGLFYYGGVAGAPGYYEERLSVYDRAGAPCPRCRTPIRRTVQAARSTFFCPVCQGRMRRRNSRS